MYNKKSKSLIGFLDTHFEKIPEKEQPSIDLENLIFARDIVNCFEFVNNIHISGRTVAYALSEWGANRFITRGLTNSQPYYIRKKIASQNEYIKPSLNEEDLMITNKLRLLERFIVDKGFNISTIYKEMLNPAETDEELDSKKEPEIPIKNPIKKKAPIKLAKIKPKKTPISKNKKLLDVKLPDITEEQSTTFSSETIQKIKEFSKPDSKELANLFDQVKKQRSKKLVNMYIEETIKDGTEFLNEYIEMTKKETEILREILVAKNISFKRSEELMAKSISGLDMRLTKFKGYFNYDIIEYKEFFDELKYPLFSYGLCLFPIKTMLRYYPIKAIHHNGKFYTKIKDTWNVDHSLRLISFKISEDLRNYIRKLFQTIYFDIYSYREFNSNFMTHTPAVKDEFQQLIENYLNVLKVETFRNTVKEIVKERDCFLLIKDGDIFSDVSLLEGEAVKSNRDEMVNEICCLFDNYGSNKIELENYATELIRFHCFD